MIAVLKQGVTEKQTENLISWFKSQGLDVNISKGQFHTVIGLIGDTSKIDVDLIESLDIIDSVKRITEPFKSSNRKFHPEDTIIEVGDIKIGGGNFALIAGPCSIESYEQLSGIAAEVKKAGASILRGGAFKPRTSPYDFQGLGSEGMEVMEKVKALAGLPIITEIMNANHLPLFDDVDIIQVGARNMQNFELLKELGKTDKVIMLKRGLANTLKELLMSAEYIMSEGNHKVILCERGIRTFESYTRNTLDLSAIPMLHELSHLPVIVDPSHATGIAKLVKPMALAATAAGADGIMIEVHNDPIHALCDGAQSITPDQFSEIAEKIRLIRGII